MRGTVCSAFLLALVLPVRTSEFDFYLPPELIAQHPVIQRDQSRLLVLERSSGKLFHGKFPDLIQYLAPGDVLVLNDSKVIPARLRGINKTSGSEFELLLLEENAPNDWWAMVRPGKRARLNTCIVLRKQVSGEPSDVEALVIGKNNEGHCRLQFSGTGNILEVLPSVGEVPLPPYIERASGNDPEDLARYQTVYARQEGSVAAPTAGLHFTTELLQRIRAKQIEVRALTLHVGAGTFAPIKAENLSGHVMHEERFSVSEDTAQTINAAKKERRRILAVGTTTARTLESIAAQNGGRIVAGAGQTRIFIHAPYRFRIVDAMLTNFHLPCSTLLVLVSAFAAPSQLRGREMILSAYAEAIQQRYRFFSYGDAMLIL